MTSFKNFQVDRNKKSRHGSTNDMSRKYTKEGKSDKLMNGIARWASFYRANPHRFVEEYFGMTLKLFQKILIYMMMHNHYFMYLASRGQGVLKTPI